MEPNLVESIYVRSSIKFLHFVLFRQQIWPPRAILITDWLLLKKSSPLKRLGQMEPILTGSIYVRPSITFLRFVPLDQQIWLPRAILVSDWLMLKQSSLKLLGQIKPNLAGSIYRSLQVYQRSYSQVGHRVLSDFTLKIVRQMSDKILPGRSESPLSDS
jgi:hypothetical protein